MPQPQISLHTTSKSSWKIPMPHSSSKYYRLYYANKSGKRIIISYYFLDISVKRLKVKQLQDELKGRGIMVDEKENRAGMIRVLENEMAKEIKELQTEKIGELK